MHAPPSVPKLYYSPGACSLAAHILLEEIGAPFELELVSIRDGAHTRPEYRAIHPLQRVPSLAVNGENITELGAILHFLADAHPTLNLVPPVGTIERARSLEWCSFLASAVHIAFAQLWRAERFTAEAAAHEGVKAAGRRAVESLFALIEEKLGDRAFVLGDRYTVCDPYVLVFYRWGNRVELPMSRYIRWTAHTDRMLARGATRRAFERENIQIQ